MSAVLDIDALEAEARNLVMDVILKQATCKKWFDVSALNKLDQFFDDEAETRARNMREFKILRKIHCIDFDDIPADLRAAIPELIATVIMVARENFEQRLATKVVS